MKKLSLNLQLEMVQYNAALVINSAVKGTPRDPIYSWLGLESLASRIWSHQILFFHKMVNGLSLLYIVIY